QKPVGSIIWLHGLGANGNDFVPIANELKMDDLALRFIFPHAPLRAVTLNNGHVMPAWFDIYSLDRNQIIDEQGISDSNALLKHYIDHEVEQKIPANKIVLAGFSQGAVIALTTGLHYSSALAGLIALSGYLPGIEKNTHALGNANKNTPIFIGHGKEDTLIPYH